MAINQMDTTEIHAPNSDCDFDGGIDSPTSTDQELPATADTAPTSDLKSCEHQLPPVLS